MDDTYLIEIRLARTKWRIRNTIFAIAGTFGLEPFMERHPHITLFGPLVLNEGVAPDELLAVIGRAVRGTGPVPFLINGWEIRRGMHGSVIAFAVTPSETLQNLTRTLTGILGPISQSLNAWDSQPDAKWFHVTLANGLGEKQASACFRKLTKKTDIPHSSSVARHAGFSRRILTRIRQFLKRGIPEHFYPELLDGSGLRITVMQNDEILAEYDLLNDRWIYGDHSHDSGPWKETLGQYRRAAGFERQSPQKPEPDDIFLIADLHLGHANIIRYCSRPFVFADCTEMDAVLIRNWNFTVGNDSPVYHVGDLRYGRGAPPVAGYLEQLGGRVTFITGNHDEPMPGWERSAEIRYGGRRFFLVHNPDDAPPGFDGWIIHGHHHNNELREYPFMDFIHRRINVSAEVIGYVPIGIREIDSRIREQESAGGPGQVLLRYPHVARQDQAL
jgi:calcineurin-like phosphoesterase family protein